MPADRDRATGASRSTVEGYDWVVVTSPNGARELVADASGALPRIAAVGPGTAETLRELGVEPAFVPRVSSQDGLLDEFPRPAGRVLFAAAEGARRRSSRSSAPTSSRSTGRGSSGRRARRRETSSCSRRARRRGRSRSSAADIPAVSIGPQTTARRAKPGLEVVAEAETHDLDGLVAAVGSLPSR